MFCASKLMYELNLLLHSFLWDFLSKFFLIGLFSKNLIKSVDNTSQNWLGFSIICAFFVNCYSSLLKNTISFFLGFLTIFIPIQNLRNWTSSFIVPWSISCGFWKLRSQGATHLPGKFKAKTYVCQLKNPFKTYICDNVSVSRVKR